MRPVKFRKAEKSKVLIGTFHEWGVVSNYEKSPNTIGIVEDLNGNIHQVYPEYIQFTDKVIN